MRESQRLTPWPSTGGGGRAPRASFWRLDARCLWTLPNERGKALREPPRGDYYRFPSTFILLSSGMLARRSALRTAAHLAGHQVGEGRVVGRVVDEVADKEHGEPYADPGQRATEGHRDEGGRDQGGSDEHGTAYAPRRVLEQSNHAPTQGGTGRAKRPSPPINNPRHRRSGEPSDEDRRVGGHDRVG